jgi:ATP-dependent helicase IRC3
MAFALRPYQQEALDSVVDNRAKGITKQLVVLPTGAGKTVIFSHLPKIADDILPMLVLAHRGELLVQAQEKILWSNPQLDVQIEKAEQHADHCDVVVASVPTLGRAESERILKYPKKYFNSIVIDEAHHAAAQSYRRILDYFDAPFILGVTATPQRSDSVRLTDVFQEIVYYKTIQDLIQDGYLSRLVGYRVKTDTDISGVETNNGDYIASQLEETINNPARNAAVVAAYEQIVPGKKAIVFASGIAHAEALAISFKHKVPTEVLLGSTSEEDRKSILSRFKTGETKVLINVGVLTEGFDEPSVESIILARPTRSSLLYTQIVGRGTRLYEGKEHCVVIDIADMTKGKKPLGLPTLLGLPADFDLQGQDLIDVAEEYKKLEQYCPGEAVRVLNPQDIELSYKRIDLFMPPPPNEIVLQYSSFVWAEVGDNDFHLGINNGESLRIYVDALGRWTVDLIQRNASQSRTTLLGHTEDMREAFVRSDRWVSNNRSNSLNLIDNNAHWRADAPTDKQVKFLKRIGIAVTADMTKGTASQIITKYYENNPRPKWLENKIQNKKYNNWT